MKNRVLVSSPGGEIESRHVCPKIGICIRGVDFLANLIILESKGIDIILGMDWLIKYKGVIRCATKTVQLTHTDATKVEFQATTESAINASLNKANAVEDSRVVSEFPDVFPEDLPGMPPNREIEFIIELVPGTAPIYKRPYRMDAN